MIDFSKSRNLLTRAQKILVGGVNSPVRAFKGVGGDPLFIQRAKGAYVWDADGNRYVDYVGSWGSAILGHAPDAIVKVVSETAKRGLSFGAPCENEIVLAELIQDAVPSMEKIRFVSSGTEACMSAIRLARGFTGKDKIIKFVGCYHGHADSFLVKAGSGVLTLGLPDSPGVPKDLAQHTLTVEFNDLDGLRELMQRYKGQVAALIVEPIMGNSGMIMPKPGFLNELRKECDAHQALLIFDEVMTGFRVAWGGAQAVYQIKPDLSTFGKVIGAGMPLAAFGGRADIMKHLAPEGPVYQAGTLSGNPLAVAVGAEGLRLLKKLDYADLQLKAEQLMDGLKSAAANRDVPASTQVLGGMFGFFFSPTSIESFNHASHLDKQVFNQFFWGLLQRGHYFAPSRFEAGFISFSHTFQDIAESVAACEHYFNNLPISGPTHLNSCRCKGC